MANKEKNQFVIGKCFMRVIKNHKLYSTFMKGCKDFISTSSDCGEIKNIMELFDYLANIADRDCSSHRRNKHDKYEPTTFVINTYLRYILEKQMMKNKKGQDLGMLGQEIFDLSCYRIFGDEFINDMEEMNKNTPKPQSNFDLFVIGVYNDYISRNNLYKEDFTFDDFIRQYGDDLRSKYEMIAREYGWER